MAAGSSSFADIFAAPQSTEPSAPTRASWGFLDHLNTTMLFIRFASLKISAGSGPAESPWCG
jgi:hypothetical protein